MLASVILLEYLKVFLLSVGAIQHSQKLYTASGRHRGRKKKIKMAARSAISNKRVSKAYYKDF